MDGGLFDIPHHIAQQFAVDSGRLDSCLDSVLRLERGMEELLARCQETGILCQECARHPKFLFDCVKSEPWCYSCECGRFVRGKDLGDLENNWLFGPWKNWKENNASLVQS